MRRWRDPFDLHHYSAGRSFSFPSISQSTFSIISFHHWSRNHKWVHWINECKHMRVVALMVGSLCLSGCLSDRLATWPGVLLLPGDCWERLCPLPWPTGGMVEGNKVWSEASNDSHCRHHSTPHCCLSSMNVSIHQSISAAGVFHLCICPFLILPSFYVFISTSFTSPLTSPTPIFLSFPPIHMFLIHPSFHLSLHPSSQPCVVLSSSRCSVFIPPSLCPYISLHVPPLCCL